MVRIRLGFHIVFQGDQFVRANAGNKLMIIADQIRYLQQQARKVWKLLGLKIDWAHKAIGKTRITLIKTIVGVGWCGEGRWAAPRRLQHCQTSRNNVSFVPAPERTDVLEPTVTRSTLFRKTILLKIYFLFNGVIGLMFWGNYTTNIIILFF